MGLTNILYVFIGGGIGSVLRFFVAKMFPFQPTAFPWATLISNVLATLILAIVVIQFKESEKWVSIQPLIVVGVCGGLSTFSTFSFENYQLLQQGQLSIVGLNILFSLGLGLLCFWFLSRL